MTHYGHHKHSSHHHHGHADHPGTQGHGLLDTVLSNTPGLGALSRKLNSGSNFWLGAAIGAAVVAVINSPDTRSALASVFRGSSGPAPAEPQNGGEVAPPQPAD